MLQMRNARLFGFWNHLTEALRTGQPQNESKNDASASPFTTLYADPARLRGFLAAMSGISYGANLAIARQVPWTKYQTYADLGTAQGDLAVQIALANPHLRGIGLDLPEVGPVFEEYAEANGVSDRLRFQPGDFFREALPAVDVLTMGTFCMTGISPRRRCWSPRHLKRSTPAARSWSMTL
jgi:O-methyltransferase domain